MTNGSLKVGGCNRHLCLLAFRNTITFMPTLWYSIDPMIPSRNSKQLLSRTLFPLSTSTKENAFILVGRDKRWSCVVFS